jgi:hypothetical protein
MESGSVFQTPAASPHILLLLPGLYGAGPHLPNLGCPLFLKPPVRYTQIDYGEMKPADSEISGHLRELRHTEQFEFVIFDKAHQRLCPPVSDNPEIKLKVPFPRSGRDAKPGVFVLSGTDSYTDQAADSRDLHGVDL